MGLFDFLKKKKEETIKFSEVEDWIEKYLENKELDNKIKSFKEEIKLKAEEAKELLNILDNAALMNENIPERAKHIMEGNRRNYIKKITLFIDDIKIPSDYLQIRGFSKELTESLDELTKETQKSYFVLREFVEAELAKVARKVKEIENTAIKFRENIEKENLHKLEELKEKLSDYKNSKQVLSNLKDIKEKQEEELKEIKNKEESIEKKISSLRTDKHFKEYESLKEEKEEIENIINKHKKNVISHFSTLEKAFKKYKRMSLNEKLIDKYLDNPSKAISEDEKFEILEVLEKMKESLGKLGLKDKKADKTKEEIKKLTKTSLTKMKEDLSKSLDEEKDIRNKLLSNMASLNISEQESWLENTQVKIKDKEREVEEIDHKIERINPKLIKQQVRDMLKEFSVIMENG